MKNLISLFVLAGVGVMGLLTACVTTTLRSVDQAQDFEATRFHRVMVIGVFKNQDLRKSFEEEFGRQWKERGVEALSSLTLLPATVSLDKAGVAPIARVQGFDAVLVTRLISRTKIPIGESAVRTVDPSVQNDMQNMNSALQVLLAPPVYVKEHDLVAVQTNLYDVAAEKRVWSGISETEVIGRIPNLIPPFVKLILRQIYVTGR